MQIHGKVFYVYEDLYISFEGVKEFYTTEILQLKTVERLCESVK